MTTVRVEVYQSGQRWHWRRIRSYTIAMSSADSWATEEEAKEVAKRIEQSYVNKENEDMNDNDARTILSEPVDDAIEATLRALLADAYAKIDRQDETIADLQKSRSDAEKTLSRVKLILL